MNKTDKFNIYEFLKKRPLSPSAISAFCGEYGSPEKWYKSYILNERQGSPETEFGSIIDKKIQNDPKFIPTLPRYPIMQHEMNVVYNKKIRMTGFADGLDLDKFLLADYKTGRVAWQQSDADSTDQLTAYLFFIYIAKKIPPEKFRCFIHWIPTTKVEYGNFDVKIDFRDNPPVPITFETKRNMGHLIVFGQKVGETVKEMQKFYDIVDELMSENVRYIMYNRATKTLKELAEHFNTTVETIRRAEKKGYEAIKKAVEIYEADEVDEDDGCDVCKRPLIACKCDD